MARRPARSVLAATAAVLAVVAFAAVRASGGLDVPGHDGLATARAGLDQQRSHDAVTQAQPNAERTVARQRDADRGIGLVDLVAPGAAMVAIVAGAGRGARSIRRVQQALHERRRLTGRAPPSLA
jgi:hypothetical protein